MQTDLQLLQRQYAELDPALVVLMHDELQGEALIEALEDLKLGALQQDSCHVVGDDKTIAYTHSMDLLKGMFPTLSVNRLERKLVTKKGDVDAAIEELLNESAVSDVNPLDQGWARKNKRKAGGRNRAVMAGDFQYREQDIKPLKDVPLKDVPLKDVPLKDMPSDPTISPALPSVHTPKDQPIDQQLAFHSKQQEADWIKVQQVLRKSKSNPLYRSATAIYSERSSQHAAMANALQSEAWHDHLARNSTKYMIDCHGCPAKDAVDFCSTRLENWHLDGSRQPLKIITGSGIHSAGGVPKIKNMLRKRLAEGSYDYEEHSSYFLVHGVKSK